MSCFKPLQAFKSPYPNVKSGKAVIMFNSSDPLDERISIPCGQCVGCRLERSRQWAMRCFHESQLHERNCFITLTYSDDNLPKDRSLDYRHFQLFMKRFRKKFGNGIRFYMCGEYGDQFGRPHYHACIFGFDFSDKYFWKYSSATNKFGRQGARIPLYRSADLESLWTDGYSSIGDVTFESAAYVARYIMKKITGDLAFEHYVDIDTGAVLTPEFTRMSLRKGIGSNWLSQFRSDVYPHDFTYIRNRKMRPPKFYDRVYEAEFPDDFARIKAKREADALIRISNEFGTSTPLPSVVNRRLAVKEACVKDSIKSLVRVVE